MAPGKYLIYFFCCSLYFNNPVSASEQSLTTETGALMEAAEPRKKEQNSLMSRILPMLASPFIMQVMMLPMMLMGMKLMLLSSMFFGKLGILLWIIHLTRNHNNYGGGLYSHNINIDHNDHMGHWNYQKNYRYGENYNYRRRRRGTP